MSSVKQASFARTASSTSPEPQGGIHGQPALADLVDDVTVVEAGLSHGQQCDNITWACAP
ncbi:hypothetical protein A1F99_008650 [Pyrenophora tritici-repentis]|nr:hypothetical protein A1F99_008650 [Pyrenophora tritici-repentis]